MISVHFIGVPVSIISEEYIPSCLLGNIAYAMI